MDSRFIKIAAIFAFALFFSIYLGFAAATAKFEAIAWVVGTCTVVFVLSLGRHVWVLVPIALGMTGTLTFMPGNPPVVWFATACVGAVMACRFLLRTRELLWRWTWLDFAIFLQVVAILQALGRNPVGMAMFGGALVGGKTYVYFFAAFTAYALLAVVKTDLRMVGAVVVSYVCLNVFDGAVLAVSQLVPAFAIAVLPFYSGIVFDSTSEGTGESTSILDMRFFGAMQMGKVLGWASFTIFDPLSNFNLLRIARFMLMASGGVLILLSGFRSVFGWLLVVFVVSALIRRRYAGLFVAAGLGLSAFAVLVASGLTKEMPFGVQRILSVLPFVEVKGDARADAENSTEWRVEMWKLALTSDRYIKNKVLGDGFGYSAAEQQAINDAAFGDRRRAGSMTSQDEALAKGTYHGFHVETIRFTGALGLVCALVGLGIFFKYAKDLIGYFRGRREWGYVMFICVPFLIHPWWYLLVFGSYRSNFPDLLVMAGLLKVLDNIRFAEGRQAAMEERLMEQPDARMMPSGQRRTV